MTQYRHLWKIDVSDRSFGFDFRLFDDIPERYLKLRRVVLNNSAPQVRVGSGQKCDHLI